jgi:serine/threonine protein kinase/tetratricopeptide (TPR) repeat protein
MNHQKDGGQVGKNILHYHILEKLGEGGMGVVYKAEDTKLKREVAIKFLPRQVSASEEERERFKIEAQAAAALNHPNITHIYAIEEADDEMFIIMEYIDGQELKEEVRNGKLEIERAVDIAIQIAEGLQAAHNKEIVHRDIKSSNIMITDDGKVKIMDFGLAKIAGGAQLTKDHSTLGTAAYMSPEQARGEDVDFRTDIWSFSVVLYEMLTGQLPFKGDYEQAVIYSILNEEPKSISELGSDVPETLQSIVEKALTKGTEERYQTTADLLTALNNFSSPVATTPLKHSKRSRAFTFVVGGFLLVAAITVIFSLRDIEFSDTQNQVVIEPVTIQWQKSIAVLPFTNMSADKEQDYFCDGIAEDILNDLTHLEGLHVVARTSSFAFKGKNQNIREIGKKLGAHTIVEGSVRKVGNRLRITAQLINVADGYHLWSERYDRELEDVFAIQDEIAKNIVQALEIKLSKREKRVLEKVKTQDLQAYDFYIRGRAYFNNGHQDKVRLAIQMFKKAIQKDKNYAFAYAGLADGYSHLYMYFDRNDGNLEQALIASQIALELDPELAEAHASRGLVLSQKKQYKESEKEFETAIQLDPKLFYAYYEYARTSRAQGKHNQAAKLFEKAIRIRPEDYEAALFLVSAYDDINLKTEMKKANQRALDVVRKHLDLNPDDSRALYLGAGALVSVNKYKEALQWVERAVSIDPNEISVLYNAACIYSKLGKVDLALDYFEKSIEAGFASREWIDNDSDLDPIRDHSRFQKALEKMN